MRRVVLLLAVFLVICPALTREGAGKGLPQKSEFPLTAGEVFEDALAQVDALKEPREEIPATLAEAHAELERVLSARVLAEIDAMPSEAGMSKYHMGLGLGIRNSWGLWGNSALAQRMRELGFMHADNMSGVILSTFWCKRHGEDFRLEARAASVRKSRAYQRLLREQTDSRVRNSRAAIRDMMMGLRCEKREVPTVQIPVRSRGRSVRSLRSFRDGVFLTVHCDWPPRQGPVLREEYSADPANGASRGRPGVDIRVKRGLYLGLDRAYRGASQGENFYTLGFYLDPEDRKIHRIQVEEVNEVYAAAVAGERAWFAGLTDGEPVLAGVGERNRVTVPLPQTDEIPDLGVDDSSLLAVYAKAVYRLTDRQWTLVHSGDILLPRSGVPPQLHGNMLFFRDEGVHGNDKRLWWLTVGEDPCLRLLPRDTGLFKPVVCDMSGRHLRSIGPLHWEETSSYGVTDSGDLWACVAHGSYLLRRSKEGQYAVAIAGNSLRYADDSNDSERADRYFSISAVTVLPDDTLLLAGCTGLYRLRGDELIQELSFALGEASDRSDKAYRRSGWRPDSILQFDDGSYLIADGSMTGVHRLGQQDDGQWRFLQVEEGNPVVW